MKKVLFLAAACVFSTFTSAQLKINSDGSAVSGNFRMDGITGNADGSGILTVTSNKINEKYNSFFYPMPGLIRTKDALTGVLPFSHMQNNTLRFYVKSNGNVYTTALLLPQAAASATRNVSAVSAFTLTSTLQKLQSLHGVVYQETDPSEEFSRRTVSEPGNQPAFLAQGLDAEEISARIEQEKSRNRIGLLASEVEQVFPDAVRTLPDGTQGILYSDLVAILIESVKELQDSVAELKARMVEGNVYKLPAAGNKELSPSGALAQNGAMLYQNTPNPFNRETEIAYRLRKDARAASVCIYNLNGQQLKKYPLSVSSLTGTVRVSASEFQPGIYIYALIIDNEMADSKRMTLTD